MASERTVLPIAGIGGYTEYVSTAFHVERRNVVTSLCSCDGCSQADKLLLRRDRAGRGRAPATAGPFLAFAHRADVRTRRPRLPYMVGFRRRRRVAAP